MTPEEKIEALRELLGNHHSPCRCMICIELLNPIRDIIDPPNPQWRQMVDALPHDVTGTHLGAVLYHLSHVANPDHYNVAEELANIVVVCEVAVGGWRADPDQAHFSDDPKTVMWLLDSLVRYVEPANYRHTGNRAAYWLRDLCDGGAE